MSENAKPPQGARPRVAQIVINFDGINVSVSGPIKDKILSLGMLELAKASVLEYKGEPQILTLPPVGQA